MSLLLLMKAIDEGNVVEIDTLCFRDPAIVNQVNGNHTPLMQAVIGGHLNVIKTLLQHGAEANQCLQEADSSPLHYACKKGEIEIVRVLLENGAEINLQDHFGHTPLMIADLANKEEVIEYLLEQGASLIVKDNEGKTVIDYAVDHEKHERVKKYKYYINLPGALGNTLLHLAALKEPSFFDEEEEEEEEEKIAREEWRITTEVELLLKNRAEANAENNQRQIALHLAAKKENTVIGGVIFHLLFHPADMETFNLDVEIFSSDANNADMSTIFDIRKKFRENSITTVSNVTHQDIEENTPWMCALRSGNFLSVKMFLAAGVDIRKDDHVLVQDLPYTKGLLSLYAIVDQHETLEAARQDLLRAFVNALFIINTQNQNLEKDDHYILMIYCIEANLFTPEDIAQEIRTWDHSTEIFLKVKFLSKYLHEYLPKIPEGKESCIKLIKALLIAANPQIPSRSNGPAARVFSQWPDATSQPSFHPQNSAPATPALPIARSGLSAMPFFKPS